VDDALVSLARDFSPHERGELISPAPESGPDPLRAIEQLRRAHPDWSADFAAAVATQRQLGHRARAGGSIPPGPWLLTRTGAQQSTHWAVATRRARHLAAAGAASVVDVTAGLGVDAWACAAAGMQVLAIERDPLTAELCRANVPEATVVNADATEIDFPELPGLAQLPEPVCWLVDPARRGTAQRIDGTRAAPERDPDRWSPPWSFVERLRTELAWVAAKAPGGFTPGPHWSAEWVGIGDYVVECAVYCLPTPALQHHRQATLLEGCDDGTDLTLAVDDDAAAPVGPLAQFVGEPHPVFHRALPALCAAGARRVSASSNWITSGEPNIPGVRWFRILDTAPAKGLRALARDHGIDSVAIKSRESTAPLGTWRARIGLPDGNRYALIIARELPEAILAERN